MSAHLTSVPKLRDGEVIAYNVGNIIKKYCGNRAACHIGSKLHGSAADNLTAWRALFPGGLFGLDIEDGPNVDYIADLCDRDFGKRHPSLLNRFEFVFCSAVLEHVIDPFTAARNIAAMMKPDAWMYFSGPWVCGYHAYPDDYWRMSFSAIKVLFPDFEWDDWFYNGTNQGVAIRPKSIESEKKLFASATVGGQASHIISDRSFPVIMVTAIGRKRPSGAPTSGVPAA